MQTRYFTACPKHSHRKEITCIWITREAVNLKSRPSGLGFREHRKRFRALWSIRRQPSDAGVRGYKPESTSIQDRKSVIIPIRPQTNSASISFFTFVPFDSALVGYYP